MRVAKDWKKIKNNTPPRFEPFLYRAEMKNDKIVRMATYKLIRVEA